MIPDLEREMREKLGKAAPGDVVPDFDAVAEWADFSRRLTPVRTRRIPLQLWLAAAAVLVALIGGVWMLRQQDTAEIAKGPQPTAQEEWVASFRQEVDKERTMIDSQIGGTTVATPEKQELSPKERRTAATQRTTRELVKNGTPCPLEISINQIMKCPNKKPAAISSCNTLEPGQAAELDYKASDAIASNCSLTVKTIEIKSIATGEAILLDEHTSITAAEVFSYMSGEKRGDIYAGIFNSDCNNKERRHNLRLGNREGDIIIQ